MKTLLITLILMLLTPPEPIPLGEFKCTAYCSCSTCCGVWADGITYTGVQAVENRTIAVDPNVIPLGSVVEINGREYVAEDIGGAIKGNRIDVYFDNHQEALAWGVQHHEVYPVK
ncbi:MAG: 3D domain-containing protein [Peptococcaceae bacterium]|nr:3D domain-containing protein [Peptococcaceae bacterium]